MTSTLRMLLAKPVSRRVSDSTESEMLLLAVKSANGQ
jgi:hypothetical protein